LTDADKIPQKAGGAQIVLEFSPSGGRRRDEGGGRRDELKAFSLSVHRCSFYRALQPASDEEITVGAGLVPARRLSKLNLND
jgi:hypothetical protein